MTLVAPVLQTLPEAQLFASCQKNVKPCGLAGRLITWPWGLLSGASRSLEALWWKVHRQKASECALLLFAVAVENSAEPKNCDPYCISKAHSTDAAPTAS